MKPTPEQINKMPGTNWFLPFVILLPVAAYITGYVTHKDLPPPPPEKHATLYSVAKEVTLTVWDYVF